MSDQMTIRLPKDLSAQLKAAARRSHRKRSDIVREALRSYLEPPLSWKKGHAYDRIRHLIGAFDTGIPDLAERHSEYVYESLKRRR